MSADGKDTAARLVAAMWSWRAAAENFDRPRPIVLPTPKEIQLVCVLYLLTFSAQPPPNLDGLGGGCPKYRGSPGLLYS